MNSTNSLAVGNLPTPSILDDRWLSYEDLERVCGWKSGTARAKKCDGSLPISFYKLGGRIRFRASELEAWVNQNRGTPKR